MGCRRRALLKSDYRITFNDMTFSQETGIQNYIWYCNDTYIFPQILCATATRKFGTEFFRILDVYRNYYVTDIKLLLPINIRNISKNIHSYGRSQVRLPMGSLEFLIGQTMALGSISL